MTYAHEGYTVEMRGETYTFSYDGYFYHNQTRRWTGGFAGTILYITHHEHMNCTMIDHGTSIGRSRWMFKPSTIEQIQEHLRHVVAEILKLSDRERFNHGLIDDFEEDIVTYIQDGYTVEIKANVFGFVVYVTSPDDDVRRADGNWVFMEGAVAAASRTIEAMKREAQELANGKP